MRASTSRVWIVYAQPETFAYRKIALRRGDRSRLEQLVRSRTTTWRMVARAQIVRASPLIAHARDCMPHHRHQEFLAFLRQMVRSVPKDLAVHVILDNYATHKHAAVKRWLARHRRVHFHFTPTSTSRLDLVERFFGTLTERQICRLAVTSVGELIAVITMYIDQRNEISMRMKKTFQSAVLSHSPRRFQSPSSPTRESDSKLLVTCVRHAEDVRNISHAHFVARM